MSLRADRSIPYERMGMGNALGIDLTDKVVIFKQEYLSVVATDHPFLVGGAGFGALPFTQGNALGGEFLSDGESTRMEGYMVERLATDEEIEAAKRHREELDASK